MTANPNSKFKIDWGLLAALAIPLVALLPLLTHAGLPNTADGPAHLMRQVELNRAWSEGNFYPRWGTDLAHGHGMPIFSYAPPFLYQLTQLFHLTGLPLDESMKGVLVVDFLLYSVGMFLFARRVYGPYPALLAAAVYVYAPYRLREAYIQGNYGQFSGLAFYPLIFWAFHGLLTDGRPRYWLAAPLALAGLLFSHNISFMLFAPLLAAYLLFLIALTGWQGGKEAGVQDGKNSAIHNSQFATRLFTRAVVAGLLGLGLAAIFWLPAFGERHDIKLEGITQGFFDFRENFISLAEFLSPPLRLDLAAINPEFPLSLGLPQLIGAGLGLLFVVGHWSLVTRHWQRRKGAESQSEIHNSQFAIHNSQFAHALFFAAFLLLYAFLAVPYSVGLWEAVPLLELAEFPWRMLGPAIFCAAALSAAGLSMINEKLGTSNEKKQLFIIYFSLLIVITLNAPYLYPTQYIKWGTPTPADAFAYEVTSGAIGTTSTGEFLPRWAQQHPEPDALWPDYEAGRPPQKLDPATLPAGATVETISHLSESDTLRLDTPAAFVATLRTLYWPGWQLTLNGQPVEFDITPTTGLIQTTIPPGQHTLTLQLESTPLRTAGLWLSLLSLLGLAGATVFVWRTQRRKVARWQGGNDAESQGRRDTGEQERKVAELQSRKSQFAIHPSSFVILAVFLLALFLLSRPLEPLFVLRSNPNAPIPADRHPGVDFGGQQRLVGVDDWPEIVTLTSNRPTDLTATLYWRALQDLDTNYSVFLHLDTLDGQTVATVDEVNPENIPTRNWPPGLYLRNPLHLRLPPHLPPIRYNLTTGVYHRDTGQRLPLADGSTAFALGPVWLTQPRPAALPPPLATFGSDPTISLHQAELSGRILRLMWHTDRPIPQNYSIFVHVLDAAGNLLAQADGVPYGGLYPLPNWLPGEPVHDERAIELPPDAATIALGLYDPASGARLPAAAAGGQPLPNNSFVIQVTP